MPLSLNDMFTSVLSFSHWQQLGLAFLLGSFAVATLSDLRRLSAQREFLEVWVIFVAVVFAHDLYDNHQDGVTAGYLALKWGLIGLGSAVCWRGVGLLLRLAPGDVAALAAAASLLTPVLIVLFYLTAKLLALGVGPLLRRRGPYWPFMPVVSLATLAVLALGLAR
jgi:hypothetical protein